MKKYILLTLIVISFFLIGSKIYNSTMSKIKVGDRVPSFSLKNQNGETISIDSSIGKTMVIYFYPKDDTPGCTKEACKFRDEYERFTDLGTMVIGISADSVESHKKFEEKYNLPFTLLADTENKVRNMFGVPKNLFLIPGRVTYIIDTNGIVKYIFNSQLSAEKHIDNALEELNKL